MPNWTGIITNAGTSLLSEWVNEKTLTITSAQAGTGTVPAVALMGQTALVNPKQTPAIAGGGEIEGGKRISLQVTAAETEYTLNQFGLYAKVDDGSPVLLAIYQNEKGIPIPSLSDTPDFLYTFQAGISVSNQGTWKVTISASANLTWEFVGVPNGIAGLDTTGKVPKEQLPEMDYIPNDEKGKAEGVATLGPDGKLADNQVPSAGKVAYDNGTSGLKTGDVQGAIDLLWARKPASVYHVTVKALEWTEDTNVLSIPGLGANDAVLIGTDDTATEEQWEAAENAMYRGVGQGSEKITLKARGTVPTIDFPLLVYAWQKE